MENLTIDDGESTIGKAQIGHEFNTSSLILWMLYGTLYCYLASYPILVIHAIRKELDLWGKKNSLKCRIFTYIAIITIAIIVFFCCTNKTIQSIYFPVIVSLLLIYFFIKTINNGEGYHYAKKLAHIRNPKMEEKENHGEITKDFIESYKHLREHGNTALIIIMEIILAMSLYFAIQLDYSNSSTDMIPHTIIVVLIWIIPAALVYFYGHYLEIRFSEDPELDKTDNP